MNGIHVEVSLSLSHSGPGAVLATTSVRRVARGLAALHADPAKATLQLEEAVRGHMLELEALEASLADKSDLLMEAMVAFLAVCGDCTVA